LEVYRSSILKCPSCDDVLRPVVTEACTIDACPGCDGLWVEWFDGEVAALVAEAETLREPQARSVHSSGRPQVAAGRCPACGVALVLELYRFPDLSADELIHGVDLRRCPSCSGAFVPAGSTYLIVDRARSKVPLSTVQATWLWVRSLFQRRS
jgi:Zn-finger nucleic acid-binding protein